MKIEMALCLTGLAACYLGACIPWQAMGLSIAVTGAFAFGLSYFMLEWELAWEL